MARRQPDRGAPTTTPAARAVLWLVGLSPVVVLPGGHDRFVLVTVLLVGVAVALGLRTLPRGALPRWARWGLACGVALLALAALASAAPWAQLWGRWPRYEGLVALPAAAGALWLGARVLGPTAHATARLTLERALAVAAVAGGMAATLDAVGAGLLSSTAARSGGLLGNASELGVFGVLVAGVLTAGLAEAVSGTDGRAVDARRAWWTGAGVAGAVASVVLSGSRGALGALGVALVVLAVGVGAPRGRRARALGAVGAVAVVALALTAAVPTTLARVTGSSPLGSATVEGRRLLWSQTLRLVGEHPLVGVGPSGFVEAIGAFHTEAWATTVGTANPPDSPHAWPLQAAAAGGLPLAALAVALLAAGVVAGVRRVRREQDAGRRTLLVGVMAALAGYVTALGVHFTSPTTSSLAALLAGALIAVPPAAPAARGRAQAAAAWVGRVALAVWLVVVAAATCAEWALAAAYRAVDAGDVAAGGRADEAFGVAQTLRPWDGDVSVMAAHAFGTLAVNGLPEAAEPAAAWADRALARIPTSSLALAARASAQEARGDLAAAEETLTALVEREPTNAEWAMRRGIVRGTAGDLEGAAADFRDAARLSPDSPGPWRNLAVVHELMGDEDAAAAAEREADARASDAP